MSSPESIVLRKQIITVFGSISAITFFAFGIRAVLFANLWLGVFELFVSILFAVSLYLLWVKQIINLPARIIVFFVMLISLLVFYTGGVANTGNLWIILVPLFPLILLNVKEGFIWLLTYTVILVTMIILGMMEVLVLKFSFIELRQTLIVFILFSISLYYNEKIKFLARQSLRKSHNEIREKDQLLYVQSRSAQIGEMLSMIAHQWRQPLNAINASGIKILLQQEMQSLDKVSIKEHCHFVEDMTNRMSKTINNFMNFFKPDQNINTFKIEELIDNIRSLVGIQLENIGVTIQYETEDHIAINSYKNELAHVLINLITNARDAYQEHDIEDQVIMINCTKKEREVTIQVIDYAGGIPEEVIGKIFNPYFTTKEQGKGTGIGLHMSKRIINEIFHGEISVHNENNGAVFSIVFEEALKE